MSRRKKHKQDSEEKADIDLTPMLDVVFIMLIFFIVTASFVKEQTINVNVPDDDQVNQPPPPDSTSILIVVNAADEVEIDGRRVDIRSVRALIAQKHAESPEAGVVVRAHEDSTAETYVAIADAAQEAMGRFNVSLVPYSDRASRRR